MALVPTLITVTVTTAGTRTQVTSNTGILPTAVYFEAPAANTGQIYIGGSTVSSTSYFARLPIPSTTSAPSWGISSNAGTGRIGGTGLQLSSFYIDSSVNGDKVLVTYIYESQG